MDFDPQIHDDSEEHEADGSSMPPLVTFPLVARGSRTMTDLGQGDSLVGGLTNLYIPRQVSERRSIPQIRLQLSIPELSVSQESTPQSDSPETPASTVTSPVAGVVDLTKNVTTVSKYAVAQGGLSDIYRGEWHCPSEDERGPQKLVVCISNVPIIRISTDFG